MKHNDFSSIHSHLVRVQDSFISLTHRRGISCRNQRCQVHPEIRNHEDLEFIRLGSQRVVRVLHITPKSISGYIRPFVTEIYEKGNKENDRSSSWDVSTEEYWFTRSNRPYRFCDDCNRITPPCKNQKLAQSQEKLSGKQPTYERNEVTSRDCTSLILSENYQRSIEAFADRFARELLSECIVAKSSCLADSPNFKNVICERVPVSESKNRCWLGEGLNDKIMDGDPSKILGTSKINSLDNSTDFGTVEHPRYNSKHKICDASFGTCSGGFINHSFSGSLNEPDGIENSNSEYGKAAQNTSASNGPVQYKFESSNISQIVSQGSDSGANCYLLESRKFIKSEGIAFFSNIKEECSDQTVTCLNANVSVLKEAGANDVISQGDDFGELTDLSEHVRFHVPYPKDLQVNQETNGVTQDSCEHIRNNQKPLLLFLHGVGSSADVWSVLLKYFSAVGYEVLAPDMLGHGYSSAPDKRAAYTFDRLLEDILQIFDRFVSDRQRCVVIGHSYGSCFAAALAKHRSQQVTQLVLLSSGGPSPLVPKQALFSLPPCIASLMRPFLMCGLKRDLFYAPRGKHLPSFCTYELPPYVMNHVERGQEWSDGDSTFHRRILVPTLLVHGLKDPHISLVEECEMERTIPRSFLEVLPNAGHMPMLDAPEQLCHMIHCFMTWWSS